MNMAFTLRFSTYQSCPELESTNQVLKVTVASLTDTELGDLPVLGRNSSSDHQREPMIYSESPASATDFLGKLWAGSSFPGNFRSQA